MRPHLEDPMPLTHLDDAPSHRRLRGQAVQDAIVGEVAIPTDFALFASKAFPGKGNRQWGKRLLLSSFLGAFMRRSMHPPIDALAPDVRLAIEIIDIREGDSGPEALLDHPDRALDFALRLWRKRFADPRSDPNGSHEIRKQRVPPWDFVLHF